MKHVKEEGKINKEANRVSQDSELREIISEISPADQGAIREAQARQDCRVKVPKSLGRLEDISIKIAGITGEPYGNDVQNQAIILMCADNGIVEEGVASAPQTVTLMQSINFTKKITGVGSQAKHFGIDILPIDVGIRLPVPEEFLTAEMLKSRDAFGEKLVNRRISNGTKNFLKESAMTREETIRAIKVGVEAAEVCKNAGISLVGVGEMGIGNTTTASAIITALAIQKGAAPEGCSPGTSSVSSSGTAHESSGAAPSIEALLDQVVGRGGGLNDEGLARKKAVIAEGIKKYMDSYIVKESGEIDIVSLMSALGGFDIAAMVGAYLGAAKCKLPVVIDGVISIAAALLAAELCPTVKDYMFTSHKSEEGGYSVAVELLGIDPMYDLGMKLGEGSGCPIAFKIIEAACAVMNNMWSLDEAQVDSAYLEKLKTQGQFQ